MTLRGMEGAMAGDAVEVAEGIRRILAPNPSAMTGPGTNTYLLGGAGGAVVDPGPDDDGHLAAILAASGGRLGTILVTHPHLDHSALAPRLARATGAPVLGFGGYAEGRGALARELAAAGLAGGGEGADDAFRPDRRLADGERLAGDGWEIEALHTPGHHAGHLSFRMGDAIVSGDTVLGFASTLISPPDGDLAAFRGSCARLAASGAARLLPGHGDPLAAPGERIGWLLAHRAERDAQILAALADGPATAADLAARIYADLPPGMHGMAARNVFAHLLAAWEDRRVATPGKPAADAAFALA